MDCGIISMQIILTIPKATSSEGNKMEKCDYSQINTKRPAISQRISGKLENFSEYVSKSGGKYFLIYCCKCIKSTILER